MDRPGFPHARVTRAAIIATVLFALAALAFDRWYHASLIAHERDRPVAPLVIGVQPSITSTAPLADDAFARELGVTRTASIVIGVLVAWLTVIFASRQQRLARAVYDRTRDLQVANTELRREMGERGEIEDRLRSNADRLRLALRSGRMGSWEYEIDSRTIFWTAGAMQMLGAPAEDTATDGATFMASVPSEFQSIVRDAFQQTVEAGPGHECRVEFRYRTPDGSERWFYASGELESGDGQRSDRLVGVLVDVTERHHLEEQLIQSQKMEAVGTLAGGIAHDFNNLLTAILGFAQLSQMQAAAIPVDGTPDSIREGLDELRTDLDEIVKAGERASLLTGQLLAFSRRQVHKPTRIDVNGSVREVERMLQRLIGERISLTTHLSMRALPVIADPGQIAQVVVNLVVNARDALPSGGRIDLSTEELTVLDAADAPFAGLSPGHWGVLTVEDNGVGMPPEVQARIFEPFFTTKRVGEGTGLGLSTVYGIVTQAGGKVVVQSAVDRGTSVHVLMPLQTDASATSAGNEAPASVVADGARVLVVEDEPGLRRLVAEILARRGFAVEVAANGEEALGILSAATSQPDLVLSDVVMPGIGGRALAEEIDKRGLEVPVLFMSGYPAGQELPDDEGHAFIGKPFTPEALIRKVRDALDRAKGRT